MEKFNCESIQISVEFKESQFKYKDFVADTDPSDKGTKFIVYHYGTKQKNKKEHAHLILDLDGEKSSFRLEYHRGKTELVDVREPYLEDVMQWFGTFFRKKEFEVSVSAVYAFDKTKYESLIQFNYPLVFKHELKDEMLVAGYELELPKNSLVSKMVISDKPKAYLAILFARYKANLSEIYIYKEMEKFQQYAKFFIKEVKKNGGK